MGTIQVTRCPISSNASRHASEEPTASPSGFVCDTITIFCACLLYTSISNAWKKWQGEALGLTRLNTVASKQEYERAFQAWAQDKPEYHDVLKELKAEYARIFDAYFALELMSETIRTGELNRIYNRPISFYRSL